MGCILSSQLRRFEAHQDALEALDEAQSDMANRLIQPGGEMYPLESNNFWQAVFDEACLDKFNDKTPLNNPAALGAEIIRCVSIFWADKATEAAEFHFEGNTDE